MAKSRKIGKSGRSYSSLPDHKRNKKLLTPPLKSMPNLAFRSWVDERLPDVLWAVLLANALPRKDYLSLFERIAETAIGLRDTKSFITHSALAGEAEVIFNTIFEPLFDNGSALQALAPILLFEDLPDFKHWQLRLPTPKPDESWTALARAVARCLDHQSDPSTDIRWLKLAFLGLQHRLHAPAQVVERLANYSRDADGVSGPLVRATEMALSASEMFTVGDWPTRFWDACLQFTPCSFVNLKLPESSFPHDDVVRQHAETTAKLVHHFFQTVKTTSVDARHDGVFGIALYGLTLVASLFRPHSGRPAGRIVLRSLVEVFLTFAYLIKHDDAKVWQKFRSHGSGQAKLAFLKILESGGERPKYIDLSTLESFANEDMWQEFVDINIGHWAGTDLRRMSEEAGVKDVYDKYYDWPSTFVHGQWPAIRNTAFQICGNPLHRLHRIPRLPRIDLEDVSWDAVFLCNRILELVDKAYPEFEARIAVPEPVGTAVETETHDPAQS